MPCLFLLYLGTVLVQEGGLLVVSLLLSNLLDSHATHHEPTLHADVRNVANDLPQDGSHRPLVHLNGLEQL